MQQPNAMPRREKNDVPVKLWLPETLYQALQDLATDREQSLSEYVRKALEMYTYGAYRKVSLQRARQDGRRGVAHTGTIRGA